MTGSVATSQLPSTVIPVITQWGHEQWVTVTLMKTMHRLSSVALHSSKPTWLWPLLTIQSASGRDQHWVLHMHHSSEISQLPGGSVIKLDPFHHGRRLCSYWKKNLFWTRTALQPWLVWLSAWKRPVNQRITGSIPNQGTCLGCRLGPQHGACERQSHIDVSLPLFLSPLPSL